MKEMMDAVIFEATGKYKVTRVEKPKIKNPDEVLLKVEAASICGSDMGILHDPQEHRGIIGTILGHEYVGEIIEKGDAVKAFEVGDRVVLDPNLACGSCYYCQKGMPNMCRAVEEDFLVLGQSIDGGFAQYSIVPQKALVKISKDLDARIAVFAEPMTCVMNAVSKIPLVPGESVLILGSGAAGNYFIQMMKANGAGKIYATTRSEFRTKFAYQSGATKVINPEKESIEDVIMKDTDGIGADVVIDTAGVLLETAIVCARKGGRILVFGLNEAKKQTVSEVKISRKELTIYGSYIGRFTLPDTVKILESGLLNLEILITHELPLREFGKGYDAIRNGEAVEVVLYPFR